MLKAIERMVAAATCAMFAAMLVPLLSPASAAARTFAASVKVSGSGRAIPHGFFGLSIEYTELRDYELEGAAFDNVLSLIRPRDGGPLTLRVGGKSADHVVWEPTAPAADAAPTPTHKLPRGISAITPSWLSSLAALVRQEDLHVILDLNLAVHSPTMEAAFTSAANATLPHGTLAGLEIGNEPDMYHYQPKLTAERVSTTTRTTPRDWWNNYSATDYRNDYLAYARTLKSAVPRVPLGGPDIVGPKPDWFSALTGLGRFDPGFLAVHRYPAATCWAPTSPGYPTIPRLLNTNASAGLAASVRSAVSYAHARGMALRITEMNSVSCGGNRGVADSFATALWAPDALFSMIDAGVDGVNWHIRPESVNAPFVLVKDGIAALPELYGLAVFAQMTRGQPRVLDATVTSPSALNLRAWAVRSGASENVLLLDKGAATASVTLTAGSGSGSATVRRLTAPRIGATGGVRFAGMRIGVDGRWQGREVTSSVSARGGRYSVTVPGYSAALVTISTRG